MEKKIAPNVFYSVNQKSKQEVWGQTVREVIEFVCVNSH